MAFIRGEKPRVCIFCMKARDNDDRRNFVLDRGQHCFSLLNTFPYAAGHVMIAPYEHEGTPEKLSNETTAEMMELAKRAIGALRVAEKSAAFNVGMNIGEAAGAGFADHIHLHVVPRWNGDSNFLPVLGDVRLIPETLEDTYDKLLAAGIAETSKNS
jgi:ATP adenylyltransferase